MNHKEEMLQWMERLETYAREQKMPMRILDGIQECREHAKKEDMPWQMICRDVEELLESVRSKAQKADMALREKESGGVSVEQVRGKLAQMAEQCHGENQDSLEGIAEKRNLHVMECMRKMDEISHTEAHLDLMLDEGQYFKFFDNIKSGYERDMAVTAREMLASVGGNYDYMIDHMRSMFQSIGGRAAGMSGEQFYRKYEEGRDFLEKRLEGEVRTANFGSGAITAFAKKTREGISEIVRKLKLKKKIFGILPLLIIVVYLFGKAASAEPEVKHVSSYMEDFDDSGLGGAVMDFVKDKASGIGIFRAFGAIFKGLAVAIGSVLIFLVLLLIVIYVFYLKKLDAWYRKQICGKCGEYLKPELEDFRRQNVLLRNAGQMTEHLAEECEQQYLGMLNRVFEGTEYAEEPAGETDLERLLREWGAFK